MARNLARLNWRVRIIHHGQCHGPLTRYVTLRVAHVPGMPGTFSPPPQVSYPAMPGSLTSDFLWSRWRVPGIPGACATRNFTYLVRGTWLLIFTKASAAMVLSFCFKNIPVSAPEEWPIYKEGLFSVWHPMSTLVLWCLCTLLASRISNQLVLTLFLPILPLPKWGFGCKSRETY